MDEKANQVMHNTMHLQRVAATLYFQEQQLPSLSKEDNSSNLGLCV